MANANTLVVSLTTGEMRRQNPLSQIATSGMHPLLLKQWLKEGDLLTRRVALQEARLDGVRKETTFLYCAFFAFHAAFVQLLFLSSSASFGSLAVCRQS